MKIPAGAGKHCLRTQVLSSNRPDTGRTKPFSRGDEAILKQTAAYPAGYKRGMTNMQFFFDLIWGQSRSRYLAEMGQMEAPND